MFSHTPKFIIEPHYFTGCINGVFIYVYRENLIAIVQQNFKIDSLLKL